MIAAAGNDRRSVGLRDADGWSQVSAKLNGQSRYLQKQDEADLPGCMVFVLVFVVFDEKSVRDSGEKNNTCIFSVPSSRE